jgi:hypothetical protein
MARYRCKRCGYTGSKLIFQFTDHNYCVAANKEDVEYISEAPKWFKNKGLGEAIIGLPIGCPKCHATGVNYFDLIG